MSLAKSQIYTLSDIDDWKIKYDNKGGLIPEEEHIKYTSEDYDFNEWIRISDKDFKNVSEKIIKKGKQIILGYINPFYFRGSVFSRPRECFSYLFNNSLVAFIPKNKHYNANPNFPNFRKEKLLDHINLVLSSEDRRSLEKLAFELDLPLRKK